MYKFILFWQLWCTLGSYNSVSQPVNDTVFTIYRTVPRQEELNAFMKALTVETLHYGQKWLRTIRSADHGSQRHIEKKLCDSTACHFIILPEVLLHCMLPNVPGCIPRRLSLISYEDAISLTFWPNGWLYFSTSLVISRESQQYQNLINIFH